LAGAASSPVLTRSGVVPHANSNPASNEVIQSRFLSYVAVIRRSPISHHGAWARGRNEPRGFGGMKEILEFFLECSLNITSTRAASVRQHCRFLGYNTAIPS